MNTMKFLPFLTSSLAERMQEAGLNTLIGMGIVVVVLIFIAFVIYLFKFIPGNKDNKTKESKKKHSNKQSEVNKPASKSTGIQDTKANDLEDNPDLVAVITAAIMANDNELVAVITAAIMASMVEEGIEVPADGLVIRSIRRKTTYKK